MENASKALIMAGSVLIALIVISLLVVFYNNIRNLQKTELSVEQQEKAGEFNKQYEVYQRDIYGSELLSLVNKINDYNKIEAENEGYTKIEIYVTFEKNVDSTYFSKGTYNSSTMKNKINKLDKKIEELGNQTIKSKKSSSITRKVSKLATMRTADIEALGFEQSDYKEQVATYNLHKSLLTQIKSQAFAYSKTDYDNNTGRITKMYYTYKK